MLGEAEAVLNIGYDSQGKRIVVINTERKATIKCLPLCRFSLLMNVLKPI